MIRGKFNINELFIIVIYNMSLYWCLNVINIYVKGLI